MVASQIIRLAIQVIDLTSFQHSHGPLSDLVRRSVVDLQ